MRGLLPLDGQPVSPYTLSHQSHLLHEPHPHSPANKRRWLAVRLQLLGAVVTGLVGAYILLSLPYGRLSGSTAGLTLLYAMQFSSALNWLIRNQVQGEK